MYSDLGEADLSNQSQGEKGAGLTEKGKVHTVHRANYEKKKKKTLDSLVPSDLILIDRGMESLDNRVLSYRTVESLSRKSYHWPPTLSMTMPFFPPRLSYLTSILLLAPPTFFLKKEFIL